jgi:hypothetical protein
MGHESRPKYFRFDLKRKETIIKRKHDNLWFFVTLSKTESM